MSYDKLKCFECKCSINFYINGEVRVLARYKVECPECGSENFFERGACFITPPKYGLESYSEAHLAD